MDQFGTGDSDLARGVTVDGAGNVYVAGYTEGVFTGQSSKGPGDAFVRKYSSGGKHLWTRQFGTSAVDYAYSVALDGSGNVYVAGYVTGTLPDQIPFGSLDAFVRKYSSGGDDLWTSQFGTAGKETARSVAAYRSGKVYVAGWTWQALPGETWEGGSDAYLRKYKGS